MQAHAFLTPQEPARSNGTPLAFAPHAIVPSSSGASRASTPVQDWTVKQRVAAEAVRRDNQEAVQQKVAARAASRAESAKEASSYSEIERLGLLADKREQERKRAARVELAREYRAQIAEKEALRAREEREKHERAHAQVAREKARAAEEAELEREEVKQRSRFEYHFLDHAKEQHHPKGQFNGLVIGDSKVYVSRVNNQQAVRAALETSVSQAYEDLAKEYAERKVVATDRERSMFAHDGMAGAGDAEKAEKRLHNAQYIQQQMREREAERREARLKKKHEQHGYFGPNDNLEQKEAVRKANQADLISQIEVDRLRRADRRQYKIDEEQCMNRVHAGEATKDTSSGSKKKDKRSATLRATLLRQQNMNALAKAVRSADR